MVWTVPFAISQILGIVILVVLMRGIFIIAKATLKLEDAFRKPLIIILFSFIFQIILAVIFHLLVYNQTSIESYSWVLPSLVGVIGSFLLVFGGTKLLQAIERK